jgi:cbb3-type cytochrome oxidase subunit 1
MDRYVKNFILMSVIYLSLAGFLGVMMLVHPSISGTYKFAHSHLMLLGWVSMMIFGVGYHILPRFTGKLLKQPRLAELQFWLANIGLAGMVAFDVLRKHGGNVEQFQGIIAVSGALELLSLLLFFYLMAGTLFAKQPEQG